MTKLGNLYYDITGNTDPLAKALNDIKPQLKAIDNQIISMASNLGGGKLANAFDPLGKSVEQVKNQMRSLVQVYQKMDLEGNSSGMEKARSRWIELQGVLQSHGVTVRNSMMENRTFAQTMAMQSNSVQQVVTKLRALEQARLSENTQTREGRKNISAINSEYKRLDTTLKDLGIRQRNFNEGFVNSGRLLNEFKGQVQSAFSVYALEGFVSKMIDVRSQFELQQTSLRAILQDKYAADKIFDQVLDLGLQSPFTTMEINGYVKQLSAYRIETEQLFDTTKRLADVSAGLGVDMGRLILAYGQVRAASVLRGQEVRQFTEAGIPLIEALADRFTKLEGVAVSTDEVFARVSKRMVSFEDVKAIFEDLTNAGGMFYNMQEIQSETLYGKVQNLGDAFDLMFNRLGENTDGVLKGTVDALWYLADNAETVGKALLALVAVMGVYKVAGIVHAMITSNMTIAEVARYYALVASRKAQDLLNLSILKNPYIAAAMLVTTLVATMWAFSDSANAATEAQDRLTKGAETYQAEIIKEQLELDRLFDELKNTKEGTEQYEKVKDQISSKWGMYLKDLDDEKRLLIDQEGAFNALTDAIEKNARARASVNLISQEEEAFAGDSSKKYQELQKGIHSVTKDDRQTAQIMRNISRHIEKGDSLSSDTEKVLEYLFEWKLNTGVFARGSRKDYIGKNIIQDIKDLKDLRDNNVALIKNNYGEDPTVKEKEKPFDLNTASLTALEKKNAELIGKRSESIGRGAKLTDANILSIDAETKAISEQIRVKEQAINTDQELEDQIKKLSEKRKTTAKDSTEYSDLTTRITGLQDKLNKGGKFTKARESAENKARIEQEKKDKASAKEKLDSEKDAISSYKRQLELIEKVRSAYNGLRDTALSFADGTVEGGKLSEKLVSEIPTRLRELFKGDEFSGILSNVLYGDSNYKTFLSNTETAISDTRKTVTDLISKLKTDVSDSNSDSISNFLNDLILKNAEIDYNATKVFQDNYIKSLKEGKTAREKILADEIPTGTGFEYRLSKIISKQKEDLGAYKEVIKTSLQGAGSEWSSYAEAITNAKIESTTEQVLQDTEKLVQSFFNETLKKQKLDIDMSGLGSASLSQLNQLRSALKAIESEFTGSGLVDAFDAVGVSIERFKGLIDSSSLGSVSDSLNSIIDSGVDGDGVLITESEKQSIILVKKIVDTLYSNNKKGLFDVDLAKIKKVEAVAKEISQAFIQLGSILEELGEATGDEGLSSIGQDMQFLGEMAMNITDITTGIISGNPQDIIKGVINTISTLIKAEAEYQKAKIEFLQQQKQLQIDYNLLLLDQIENQRNIGDSVLYDNLINKFRQTFKAAEEANKKIEETVGSRSLATEWAEIFGMKIAVASKPTENIEEYLSSISVETGVKRKKFLGITTGKKSVYGNLLEEYPKLINEAGELNLEYAESILAQKKFKDNGKEALEELVAYTKEYQEALESLDSQLNSMFGGIGDLISDALISSFHNGIFAADEFFSTVQQGIGDMVDGLVSNMIVSALFGDLLDSYIEPLKDSLLGDNPEKSITDLMGRLVSDISSSSVAAGKAVEEYAKAKEKAGLGGVNESERTGLTGGIQQTITQDSFNELTGLGYAILEKTSQTANNTSAININVSAVHNELKAQTVLITSIKDYTSNLPYMKISLDSMVNQGVKIKAI